MMARWTAPFCSGDGRQAGLLYLAAGYRDTTPVWAASHELGTRHPATALAPPGGSARAPAPASAAPEGRGATDSWRLTPCIWAGGEGRVTRGTAVRRSSRLALGGPGVSILRKYSVSVAVIRAKMFSTAATPSTMRLHRAETHSYARPRVGNDDTAPAPLPETHRIASASVGVPVHKHAEGGPHARSHPSARADYDRR